MGGLIGSRTPKSNQRGRMGDYPPAPFKMSRWPSSPGSGPQKPWQAATGECDSHTGLHFSSIGVERHTPVFQTGIQSGKGAALLPLPPLRTGREGFPSSGSSRREAPHNGAG